MRIKKPIWLRLFIHQQTFEKRVKNLSCGLLYTYWTSELDNHVAALMHPGYSQSYQEKQLPTLWGLAEHFFEAATEDYPLPMMFGKARVDERLEGMRSIFNVYDAYCEVFNQPPESSIHRTEKFQTIMAEIRDFDPSFRMPKNLVMTRKLLK